MEWVEGTAALLAQIEPQASQRASSAVVGAIVADEGLRDLLHDYTRALVDRERALAMIGAFPVVPGVFETWALFSEQALLHPRTVYQGALDWAKAFCDREEVVRLQTHVDPAHTSALRWLRHLGYEEVEREDAHDEGWACADAPDNPELLLYARSG